MRILIGITYYLPNISGLTIYAKRLAEGLAERGHQVTVLTSRYDQSLPSREVINGVEIRRSFVLFRIGKGVMMPFLPFQGVRLIKEAEIINCHLPQLEAFWLLLMGRLLGKNPVTTYHCDVRLPLSLINFLSEKGLIASNFLNCLLAKAVVNSSLDYANNSLILTFFKKKLKIIFPPIKDFSKVKEDKKFKSELSAYRKKYKIGYVGRLAADKGVEYLLLSIPFLKKRFNNFGIFIVGPKEPIGEKAYRNKIDGLYKKCKDSVFLLGTLNEKKLSTFLKSIDVLVLPSINSTEAFGMIQAEAMLCGVPIVASFLPGVRIPIKLTGMGKLTPVKNPSMMAKAVVEVLENKRDYVKPREKIEEVFSLAKTVEAYEKLFF